VTPALPRPRLPLACLLPPLLLAGCGGVAPRLPTSAADLAAMAPRKSADMLSAAAAAFDLSRVVAGVTAAASCQAGDDACDTTRKREALEATETEAGALELLVASQHALAGPQGPRAIGPDLGAVCRRLGLTCSPPGP
jgi:hypothetical protein